MATINFISCDDCVRVRMCANKHGHWHENAGGYGTPSCYKERVTFKDKCVLVLCSAAMLALIGVSVLRALGKL